MKNMTVKKCRDIRNALSLNQPVCVSSQLMLTELQEPDANAFRLMISKTQTLNAFLITNLAVDQCHYDSPSEDIAFEGSVATA